MVYDFIRSLKGGQHYDIQTNGEEMVSITISQGMEYTTRAGQRKDSTIYVTSDQHLWRKQGQKIGQNSYMICYFGRPNNDMRREEIEKCPGNTINVI